MKETKISPSKALQVALKYLIIKSITESQHIIPKKSMAVKSTLVVPDMEDFVNKSLHELKSLTITKAYWNSIFALEFTLSDGQSCKAG